eukprot:5511860-Prymnesium_polylepis.1
MRACGERALRGAAWRDDEPGKEGLLHKPALLRRARAACRRRRSRARAPGLRESPPRRARLGKHRMTRVNPTSAK